MTKINIHELHLGELLKDRGIKFKTQVGGLVPGRKFVVDFFVPSIPAVIELQGGIWMKGKTDRGGAHSLPSNIERDCEKSNLLQIEGNMVYKIPTSWLKGDGYEKLKLVLDAIKFYQEATNVNSKR